MELHKKIAKLVLYVLEIWLKSAFDPILKPDKHSLKGSENDFLM